MGMGRCKQRYHRKMFLEWAFPAVGVVNVRAAFKVLFPSLWKDLQEEPGCARIGAARFFQWRLGMALLHHAQALALKEPEGAWWAPSKRRKKPAHLAASPGVSRHRNAKDCKEAILVSKNYKYHDKEKRRDIKSKKCLKNVVLEWDLNRKPVKWLGYGPCRLCLIRAQRSGSTETLSGSKRRVDSKGNRATQTPWACKGCKVNLCLKCFGDTGPDGWDHPHHKARCQLVDILQEVEASASAAAARQSSGINSELFGEGESELGGESDDEWEEEMHCGSCSDWD